MGFTALTLAAVLASPPYVLHEWGTFTSVAGADGAAISWRPLATPSDLPSFVYARGSRDGFPGKGETRGTVRMETPVIYFYAKEPLTLSLKVSFKNGVITEWYPWARTDFPGSTVDWGQFKVVPGGQDALPREKQPSHYYPAREVDAAQVRVCQGDDVGTAQVERFLFYRGVGTFDVPLRAKLVGDTLELTGPRGPAVVFENRGGQVGFTRVTLGDAALKVSRPALSSTKADAQADVLALLLGSGLYEKEARAMVETWKDTWFEEGLRVISLVPRGMTDDVLPLEAVPTPSESVRVLVGRFEVLTDERVAQAKKMALAAKSLQPLGRFAEPLLVRARASATPAEVKRIDELLRALQTPAVASVE
ncbi:MAG: hypothetical protein U0228_09845 [Myxococcaceae bacterium]